MVRASKDKVLWVWIDSGCYAFDEKGKMYEDSVTPDGYVVDKTGNWIK